MKTWVKLYTETNEDPKIGSLTWAQRGIWAALLALAGRLDHRDEDGIETGLLDTSENTAWHLRCPQDEFDLALEAFREREMIAADGGLLCITNYTKRQRRPPSASRDAVAERVQRHRETKADDGNDDGENGNEDVTTLQNDVTRLDTDTEKSRIETETENTAADAATPPDQPSKVPKPQKSPTPAQEMFSAVAELCQIDLALITKEDRGKLNTVSKRLRDEKKTQAHVAQFARYWYAMDWRGKQGQAPLPHDILSNWGRAKEWLDNGGKNANRNTGRPTGQAGSTMRESSDPEHDLKVARQVLAREARHRKQVLQPTA